MDKILEISKEDFPDLLNEIPDKPNKLYYRGEIPNWDSYKFLAVVGSRKNSEYGMAVCQKLIQGLSKYSIYIVSGLALGIDSIAHKTALDCGLKTIAVPGSGLDNEVVYPASHLNLAKRIVDNGGLLLSEFEPKQKAAPYMFPQRNRIMAGISHAILVIEAEKESGTLITARLAVEYNRDVLTVMGSIFSSTTIGPYELIKNGATPVFSSDDILEALKIEKESKVMPQNNLSAIEKEIINCLNEPKSREKLCRLINIPINELNQTLSVMEIKGIIRETLGEIHLI